MCKNDFKKLILLKIIIKQNYLKLFSLLLILLLTLCYINNKKKNNSKNNDKYYTQVHGGITAITIVFVRAVEYFLTLQMNSRKSHDCVVGIPMAIPDPKPIHENSRQFGW